MRKDAQMILHGGWKCYDQSYGQRMVRYKQQCEDSTVRTRNYSVVPSVRNIVLDNVRGKGKSTARGSVCQNRTSFS